MLVLGLSVRVLTLDLALRLWFCYWFTWCGLYGLGLTGTSRFALGRVYFIGVGRVDLFWGEGLWMVCVLCWFWRVLVLLLAWVTSSFVFRGCVLSFVDFYFEELVLLFVGL